MALESGPISPRFGSLTRVLVGLGLVLGFLGLSSWPTTLGRFSDSDHRELRQPSGRPRLERISLASNKMPSRPDLRPDWSKDQGVSGVVKNPNVSVLARPDYEVPGTPDALAEWLQIREGGHARLGKEMREQWSTRMENFEMRERHHLAGRSDELEVAHSNWNMGRTFLRSFVATHLRDSLKKAEKKSDPVRAVTKASEKLDFIAHTGVKVEVARDVKFGSKADIVRQQGRVWMDSPWLNGAVDFQVGGDAENAVAGLPARSERYKISLDRSLPFDVHSGLVYGATTQTMTTSLSRPLAPNLSCTLENRQNLLESGNEQMARFNYHLRF